MVPTYLAAGTAAVVAFGLTPLFRSDSRRRRRLDVPNERSSHTVPTPRSGGRAIALGIAAGLATGASALDARIAMLAAAVAVLIVLAIADEGFDLPRGLRFVIQIGVASAVAVFASRRELDAVIAHWHVAGGIVALGAAVIWLTWSLNAYNFMDGINGIASAEAVIAGATLALLFGRAGDSAGQVLAVAIAGAAVGFLPWNLPSGSIFMGDVGSTTFGFLLGALVLRAGGDGMLIPAVLPLLPFLLDASVTLLIRAAKGERFFSTPHRSHFYQRLAATGWTHTQTTGVWALLAVISSGVALMLGRADRALDVGLVAGLVILHIVVGLAILAHVRRVERRGTSHQVVG
jgi:UDP-GlcNAc:undecaprenyl-phosphate GlcNAc-1-phosphate transferase